jgi:hypothetical protein
MYVCDNKSEDGEQHLHAVCIFPSKIFRGGSCPWMLMAGRDRNNIHSGTEETNIDISLGEQWSKPVSTAKM